MVPLQSRQVAPKPAPAPVVAAGRYAGLPQPLVQAYAPPKRVEAPKPRCVCRMIGMRRLIALQFCGELRCIVGCGQKRRRVVAVCQVRRPSRAQRSTYASGVKSYRNIAVPLLPAAAGEDARARANAKLLEARWQCFDPTAHTCQERQARLAEQQRRLKEEEQALRQREAALAEKRKSEAEVGSCCTRCALTPQQKFEQRRLEILESERARRAEEAKVKVASCR